MFDLGFHQQIDLATDRLSNGRIGQLWGLLTIRPDNIGAVLEPDSGCTFTILRGGVLKERGSQLECVQKFLQNCKTQFLNCKDTVEMGSNIKLKVFSYTEMC